MPKESLIFTNYIADLMVKPCGQAHIRLGDYTKRRPAKGFSIEFIPSVPDESVVTEFFTLEEGDKYRLVLAVANFGEKPIRVKVCSMEQ
jgi:hypothetical protein